jgi:hypothetical protein
VDGTGLKVDHRDLAAADGWQILDGFRQRRDFPGRFAEL